MANPMGYFSGYIWAILELHGHYKLSRERLIELLCLAMRTRSAPTFAYVVRQWQPDGMFPLKKKTGRWTVKRW